MRSLLIAVQFLTRIPVMVEGVTEREIGRSALCFPLVGALMGGILLGTYIVLALLFPIMMARVLTLMLLVILSGAFHLDGLADTVDGLYGGKDQDDALRIMRDPHIGAMGVIAIVLTLLAKVVAAVSLPEWVFRGAIFILPMLGHGAMVLAITLPYARPSGLGRVFAEHRSAWDVTFAGLIMLSATFGILRFAGLAALGVGLAGVAVLLTLCRRKIHGITGDVCGAVNEIAETGVLVALTALAPLDVWFWRWHL